MKRKTDNEELLDDVLAEAVPPDFREVLLGESLRLVRRRRRVRQARNVVAILFVLGLLGLFVWPPKKPSVAIDLPAVKPVETIQNYQCVDTQPFSTGSIITTHPFSPAHVATPGPAVEIVHTTASNYRTIDDQELLALMAAHPALLIHVGPNSEKLIFANPDDAKGFPAN